MSPLAQAGTSAAPPEQVAQLVQYASFLIQNGGWLTTAMLAALAAGAIFCLLTILDWGRRRWGLVFPVLMLAAALVLAVLSFVLFNTFSALQEVNLFWRGISVDPGERALLEAAMGAISSVGAWILAGLSGALLFVTLGGTALVRAWRAARASRRGPVAHPEWLD
jgi:uncharacterized membrane protein